MFFTLRLRRFVHYIQVFPFPPWILRWFLLVSLCSGKLWFTAFAACCSNLGGRGLPYALLSLTNPKKIIDLKFSFLLLNYAVLCLVASDSLWPMDCNPPDSSVHGDSPDKNTGVGCHGLLQGIFPTQGWNPGISHCRWILYCLNHQGSPWILEWVTYPFSRWSSWPRNWTGVSCIAGGFFTSWATREALIEV